MVSTSYQWFAHIEFQGARSHHDGCRRRKTLAALRRVEGVSYPCVTVVAVPVFPRPLGCPVAKDQFPLSNASPWVHRCYACRRGCDCRPCNLGTCLGRKKCFVGREEIKLMHAENLLVQAWQCSGVVGILLLHRYFLRRRNGHFIVKNPVLSL